jgi:hypothetical protein
MSYLCDLCRENFTEKGDTYCHLCRAEYGDDTERLDRYAQHMEIVRSTRRLAPIRLTEGETK